MADKLIRTYVLRTSHGYEDSYESLSTALHLLTDTLVVLAEHWRTPG